MSHKYTKEDDAGTMPARKRDLLIVKVVDWSDDKPENCRAYDVEVYIKGEFVPNRSKVFEFGHDKMMQAVMLKRALQKAENELHRGLE